MSKIGGIVDLGAYLSERRVYVNAAMDACLPPVDREPVHVHEAMRYAALGGGKRLRPILALAIVEIWGRPADEVRDIACGLEFIHAASLILDDLPSMDNAVNRRNMACTHTKFGEATAILGALGLIALAFDLVARNFEGAPRASVMGEAVHILAEAMGTPGIIRGQHADLAMSDNYISAADLEHVHLHKAAALFLAAIRLPLLLVNAAPEQSTALETYGMNIGLAFQITDDLLDAMASAEDDGKTTFSSLLGPEAAKEKVVRLVREAVDSLDGFGSEADPLRLLAHHVGTRTI